MKLSAPVYVLKSQAKALKKARNVSLTQALDEIAKQEGYATWSLLMASGLLAQAEEKARPKGHLFMLVESEGISGKRFEARDICWIDCSNEISADYIVAQTRSRVEPGSLIVVDPEHSHTNYRVVPLAIWYCARQSLPWLSKCDHRAFNRYPIRTRSNGWPRPLPPTQARGNISLPDH